MKNIKGMKKLELADFMHENMSLEQLQERLSNFKKTRRKFIPYGFNGTIFSLTRKEAIERIEYAIKQKTTTTSAH